MTPVDRDHWDRLYSTRDPGSVSWYQPTPETSLRLVTEAHPDRDARILDVGGGTAGLVDALLARGYRRVGVLDVSAVALEASRRRLGDDAARVEWFAEDVTQFRSPHPWDVWHDRAVFHFLVEASDRAAYRDRLLGSLAEGATVIIATFGPEGPTSCSGLDVRRYDAEGLATELGPGLVLDEALLEDHTTPAGGRQQFLFCRFHRA